MIKSIRILLFIVVVLDYEILHIDVKIALLNCNLDVSIYMVNQEDLWRKAMNRKFCLLQISIYRLKEASRLWHIRFDQVLNFMDMIKL